MARLQGGRGQKGLSAREIEILLLAASGFTNEKIHGLLGISLEAIEEAWGYIQTKMGAGSRSEAVATFAKEQDIQHREEAHRLEEEIEHRRKVEQLLHMAREGLKEQVAERTAELAQTVKSLEAEMATRKLAQESLQESELRFRTLIEGAPIAIVMFKAGLFHYANPASLSLFGYQNASDVIGKSIDTIAAPEYREIARHRIAGILAGHPINIPQEYLAQRADGTKIWVLAASTRIVLSEGPVVASFLIDVSEMKAAEEAVQASEAQFRRLFEQLSGGLLLSEVICDEDGIPVDHRRILFNDDFEKFVGLPREDLLRKTYSETQTGIPLELTRKFWEIALSGGSMQYERFNEVLGRYYDVRVFSPKRGQFAMHFLDITERHQQQLALQQAHDSLEVRVAERTVELQEANRELKMFSYAVAHDLRAPVRNLKSFTSILSEELSLDHSRPEWDYVRRIVDNANRMNEIIDDLLQLCRVGQSDIALRKVNLSEIAKKALANIASANQRESVDLRIQPDIEAVGDERLLRLVFENLLGNAWKFTGRRDDAIIEFGEIRTNDGSRFFVRDNGAGFDMAYSNSLFVPFQRLHSQNEFKGTGIGLAIVDSVVRRHGGRIWGEGAVDKGATFFFTLHDA